MVHERAESNSLLAMIGPTAWGEGRMAKNSDLDRAAQKIADARMECVKLGVAPAEIARIMLDEAVLGLAASGHSLDGIQAAFKWYGERDLVRFYEDLVKAAARKGSSLPH
ncbi:hypothetical protein [Aestuariivirga sp.]|jgi:hypothetical protein|uniref:hypothetical protein n=1 Tax=Aestuariivirga sp. TaxID=2650926 RepID=UPI0037837CCA